MWKHKTLVNLFEESKVMSCNKPLKSYQQVMIFQQGAKGSTRGHKSERNLMKAASTNVRRKNLSSSFNYSFVLEEMCAIWDTVSPQLPPILYLILLPFWSRAWSKDYCSLFLESFVHLCSNKNQTAWVNTSDLPFPATKKLLGTWPHNASPTIKQAKALPATGPNTTMALLA